MSRLENFRLGKPNYFTTITTECRKEFDECRSPTGYESLVEIADTLYWPQTPKRKAKHWKKPYVVTYDVGKPMLEKNVRLKEEASARTEEKVKSRLLYVEKKLQKLRSNFRNAWKKLANGHIN